MDSETVGHGDAKVSGREDGVFPIFVGWDCSDKAAGVRGGSAAQTLCFTISRCTVNQKIVHLGVELERGLLLRKVDLRLVGTRDPRLLSCDLGLMPTRMKSQVGVLDSPAQTETPELRSEASLGEREVAHRETQDTLDGCANHVVKRLSLLLPLMEGRGAHEVHSAHDAVTHTKQVSGGLSVLELDEFVHSGEETAKKLLFDEVGHKAVATKWDAKHLDLRVRDQLDLIRFCYPVDPDRAGQRAIWVKPRPFALGGVEVEPTPGSFRLEDVPSLGQKIDVTHYPAIIHVPLVVDRVQGLDLVHEGHDAATEVQRPQWVALLHANHRLDDVLVVVEEHRGVAVAPGGPVRHRGKHPASCLHKVVA
jgi:hypothetical protein